MPTSQLLPYVIATNPLTFRIYEVAGNVLNNNILLEIAKAIRLMVLKSMTKFLPSDTVVVHVEWISSGIKTHPMTCHTVREETSYEIGFRLANDIKFLENLKQDKIFVVRVLKS